MLQAVGRHCSRELLYIKGPSFGHVCFSCDWRSPFSCKSGRAYPYMVMKESHICSCVCGEAHEPAKGYKGMSFDWIVGGYSCNLCMRSHVCTCTYYGALWVRVGTYRGIARSRSSKELRVLSGKLLLTVLFFSAITR